MRLLWFAISGALLVSACPLSLFAQESGQSPFTGKDVITFAPDQQSKLELARQMISRQRFLEGADILESIYEKEPENKIVQNLLRSCYDRLEWHEKAERLVRRMMDGEPYSIGHNLYLAELLVKMGRVDEATATYEELANKLGGGHSSQFTILINSIMRSGLYDFAQAQIESLRIEYADSTLFGLERGEILERASDYAGAALEYLPHLLQDTTAGANRAERKLLALLQFEESSRAVEPVLVERAESDRQVRLLRLLADHYLKADRFDEAFAFTVRQDSLELFSGVPLIQFMHRCYERDRWDKVVQMAELILGGLDHSAYQQDVSFEYASALARLGRYDDALGVYAHLVATTGGSRIQSDALYGIGAMHLNYLDNLDSALHYFNSVIELQPRGASYLNALRAIPLCQMKRGELTEARTGFEQLANSRLPDDLAEEVRFRLSLIDFFRHEYDSAETGFNRILVEYPRGYYVNNALRLLLAIQDAGEDRELLNSFARANLLEVREKYDSALVEFLAIAGEEPRPLGDISLIQVIELEIGRGDSTAAGTAAEQLAEQYPESYYRPIGLKWKADIMSARKRDLGEAREIYRTLLEDFPDYPFVREVRERLRLLEEAGPVG